MGEATSMAEAAKMSQENLKNNEGWSHLKNDCYCTCY